MEKVKSVFVIMPFSSTETCTEEEWTEIYESVFRTAIEDCGYSCERALPGRGSLIKAIIEKLRNSTIVLADITDRNPNVFYELGVRHSLSKRTVIVSQRVDDIPSDLRGYWSVIYGTRPREVYEFKSEIKRILLEIEEHLDKSDSPVSDYLDYESLSIEQRMSIHLQQLSHQLVSPLFALRSHTDNLLKERISPERAKIVLESINAQAKIAARTASNFALISSILGGELDTMKAQFHPVTMSLNKLFIDLARDYQPMAWAKEVNIRVDTRNLPEAAVDPRTFPQAASNIIDNAVKYSKSYTDIVIRGENKYGERGERRLLIYVENEGIKLSREDVDKIFQRGYRTREAAMVFPSGTGLGIGLARDILRLHGGNLTAIPTDSRGLTRFVMEIPLS